MSNIKIYSKLKNKNLIKNKFPIEKFINQIVCGDCLEIMKKVPDETIDLIITSPPYNFGMPYDNHLDNINFDEYFQSMLEVWQECQRLLKKGGRICINVQPLHSSYVPTHHVFSEQLRKLGLLFKCEILWDKHTYNAKYTSWGSWKSPSMPYFKTTWEFIEVFCKGTQNKEGKKENIDISGDEFKKWTTKKWDVAPEMRMKEFEHPAMFPEEIPFRLIRLFSYVGDLVLDPFNGAGTTTLVARKLNRKYIGIDISKKYCQKAKERIKEYEQQLKFF